MTVKELINILKLFPQDLPAGAFTTHDQGRNEGNSYPWYFSEFMPINIKLVDTVENEYGGWENANEFREEDICDNCPEGGFCKKCQAKRIPVVVVGYSNS